MDESIETINSLILELSLITLLPFGVRGRDYAHATAAANAIANRTTTMDKQDLRVFEWIIEPLLKFMIQDIEDPSASKAAFALRTLMKSRICISRLIECDGLKTISQILDIILAKRTGELKTLNHIRSLVENFAICYREIARFYPWKIVDVGSIRHCVVILKYGDVALQTICASTLASLSADLDICKQLFSYGAIKPVLNCSDAEKTSPACALAGLGCITQLCRISEISDRMVQQGVVPVLERALEIKSGHNHRLIREKALYSLSFLSKNQKIRLQLCTERLLHALEEEFFVGTLHAKETIMQILMNFHNRYDSERDVTRSIRQHLYDLYADPTNTWNMKNLITKVFIVLYQEEEDYQFFFDNHIVDYVFQIIEEKPLDLQEAPVVFLIHLCKFPKFPYVLLHQKYLHSIVEILKSEDVILRELTVILLKVLILYNHTIIEQIVPEKFLYLLQKDLFNPQLYGAEYGEFIQEYLQFIIQNRVDEDYLIKQFSKEDINKYQLTTKELELFQNLFIELDAECRGHLGIDELKMLIVLKGEFMDKEEMQDLLCKYDSDLSGYLDYKEFVIMMKNWDLEFGTGWTKKYRESVKRGPIGKSWKMFNKWWNKDNLEHAQVLEAKERRKAEKAHSRQLELAFLPSEQFNVKKGNAIKSRDLGLVYSDNYGITLPPISRSPNSQSSSSRSYF